MSRVAITRALVSVYDKTGLERLAAALHAAGVEIVSTGSTAAAIIAAGLPVTTVESVTGFAECLGGRVKTLHPAIHAGLLADVTDPEHVAQLGERGIAPFQLLVSNLYPFADAVASAAPAAECVEQIDIGGPAMVRAAAKNHASVAVITAPSAYPDVAAALAAGGFTLEQRQRLAAQAFGHTASYDAAVASWFATAYAMDEIASETGWPDLVAATWSRKHVLRYGENPHQGAALYIPRGALAADSGVAAAEQLHGKEMSYNNYVDADAAWRAAGEFAQPCVAIVKHSNPCGIALGSDIAQAHRKANDCDPVSAFGGVIAASWPITAEAAAQIADIFTEVIIAPDFEPAALEILTRKKNLRVLRCPQPRWACAAVNHDSAGPASLRPPPRQAEHGQAESEQAEHGRAESGRAGSGQAGSGRAEHGQAGSGRAEPGQDRPGRRIEWRQIGGGLLMQSADVVAEPGDRPDGWTLAAGQPAGHDLLADLEFAWRACRGVKSNAILLVSDQASVGVGMGQVNRVDSARLAVARAGDRAAGSAAASDAYFPFADGLMVLAQAGVRAVVQPGGSVRDPEVIAAAQAAGLTLYLTGVRHFWH